MLFDACFTLVSLNSSPSDTQYSSKSGNEYYTAMGDSLFDDQGNPIPNPQDQSGFQLDFNQFNNPDSTFNPDSTLNNPGQGFGNPDTTFAPDTTFNFAPDTAFNQDESFPEQQEEVIDTGAVNFGFPDSAVTKVDSSLAIDSLFLDSTARMEQFRYHREDKPYTSLNTKKRSKFFAYPSASMATRNVQLDSTGRMVEIYEKVAGQQTKILLTVPLEDFIDLKMKARNRETWEQLGYKYELKDDKKDLSQLITDFTNIDIPLPSAGFLSIFGPPNIKLSIGGAVDIHGAWRNETREGVTASFLGNTRNEPDFKQQVQINVNGTIGDKLSIRADWNTERTFEYENQLKLKYTGYEDEIVKNVEAGNVSLQTSPLVGGSEALFGVKADFQFGPLSLTTLASQKKGEVKEVAISGGSTSQEFTLHAYDYSKNHYFIDTLYASRNPELDLFYRYYANPTPDEDPRYNVIDIEVWKTTTGQRNLGNERQVIAFINLPPLQGNNYESLRSVESGDVGKVELGRFIKLSEGTDYDLHRKTGFITFKTQIQESEAIAVAYRMEGQTPESGDDVIYGEFIGDETTAVPGDTTNVRKLILKLIKPKDLQPQFTQAWKLQLKNIYPVGGRKVNEEGFVMDIQYAQPGSEPANQIQGIPLLSAFGLDQISGGGAIGKDGNFDFINNTTIFQETGEIVFPVLEPFGRDFPQTVPGYDTLRFQEVYNLTVTYARQEASKDRFLLTGKYSASSTAVFNLGFVGVVENSVKVLLGGRELTPNVDYIVDYNIGQVTIKNQAALVPGADLKITYEQNDIFQLASKTLLGARGLFNFSQKTQLGFSVLNLNQQTLSDKVRIGEEPLNNSIYGVDFKTSVDLPFVTKGLNSIIPSKQMSSFSVGGEFAYINPDPNTKKSTVSSDLGKSIAYIDDFEGAKRTIPIGVSYTSWRDLSVPDRMPVIGDSSKTRQMSYKGKSYWFNVLPSDVDVTDIWPNKEVGRGDDKITVLDFVFEPGKKGMYNRFPRLETPELNWGGMMKILSQTATNLVEENIEFIEFWLKLEDENIIRHQGNAFDSLYIDLGKISEDVIPNNDLDSEDKNENDLIDNGEDLGMDELADAAEPGYDPVNNPDPSGDNYNVNLSRSDYTQINGTENNSVSLDAGGRFPDSEDLNRNLQIDQLNSYFRYAVPLDTNKTTNKFITGGGNNDSWYQIRIPLQNFTRKVGDPSFSIVEFIRVWINGVNAPIHIRLAEFNLVGSQWQKVVDPKNPQDSTLALSVVNVEDNPDYTIPLGVQRERDRSNPDEQILRNEQSLSLIIKELNDGEERQVVKHLRPLDLFNYQEMKLFIHGDERDTNSLTPQLSAYTDTANYASEVYFRFGSDTTNYYEYRLPVRPDWHELSIKFSELTTIKQLRSTATNDTTKDSTKLNGKDLGYPVPGAPGHYYRIRGNPALTRVSFFMIGVENPKGKSVVDPVSGEIWVNELRVIGADDSQGWAYSTNARFNLGDLMTVNFNMSQTNPFFHKLSDRFGTRLDSKNWGFNVDFDVLKLMPFNLPGSNLKVNYSRTEQTSNPLYVPGTDIKVDGAAAQLAGRVSQDSISRFVSTTKSLNISDTWTLAGMKFKIPSQSWIWNYTLNAMTFSFNYNQTKGRNPQTAINQSWIWNATINYQTNLSQNNFFYPADIPILGTIIGLFKDYRNVKIYYTPQSFAWNLTATRNYSYNLQRLRSALPIIGRDFKTTRNAQIGWKLTEGGLLNMNLTYGFDFQSSLAHILTRDGNNNISRSESAIWNDVFSSAFFGRNYQYQQNFEIRTQPKLPSIWELNKFFTLTLGYGSSYQWQNNFLQADLGRGAGFSNKINAGITLKLKSLAAPLFKEDKSDDSNARFDQGRGRDNQRNNTRENARDTRQRREEMPDSMNIAGSDSLKSPADSLKEDGPSKLQNVLLTLKAGAKYIFFDYETIQFNFSQDNTVSKSGIRSGGTGFVNFFTFSSNNEYGPSRSFMLGLSQDVGPRALRGNLSDNVSQRNSIDFRTARPLWEGANIDLRWKIGWQNSKSATIQTDSLGNVNVSNINSTGSINRSYVSIPLPILGGGLKKVNELYGKTNNLNESFSEGLEAFPILAKIPILKEFAKYIPRPNWSLNWDGLEKYSMFKSFTKRVSLQHAYNSDYSEGWKLDPDGNQAVQTQKISYGFAPLVGLNMTFASLWNGNFTGSIKYSTKTGYDLGASTKNITENSSRDIGISASYSKSGFELPLFGLSLKNDIELTFSYTYSKNSVIIFNMANFDEKGIPQDGTVRTTMEPRIKYVMSAKVTLSVFYRRSSVVPEGAARISPTTTNEAGLDVHIAIQ